MKKIIILFVFIAFTFSTHSQSKIAEITNPEIKDLIDQAEECYNKNPEQDCSKYYESAIKLGEKLNKPYVDYLYYSLARRKMMSGDAKGAMKIYDEQIDKCKDSMVKISFKNIKAAYLKQTGQTDEAIELYINIAKLLEERDEKDKLIINYYNTSSLLKDHYSFEKELKYLLKANKLVEETGERQLAVVILSSIADSYYWQENFEEAKKWADKSIAIPAESIEDHIGHSVGYRVLANLAYKESDWNKALDSINKSIDATKDFYADISLGNAYGFKADLLLIKKDFPEAKKAVDKSIEIFRGLNSNPGLASVLKTAGYIYQELGLYKDATEILVEQTKLLEELRFAENINVVNELATKYETEKKERQIAEQELEIQKKNVQMRNWLIAGIVLIGGFLTFLYIMRRNQKNKLKIMEKEKENEVLSARVLGEEVERSRISKELHDGIASNLVAVKLQIENNAEISQKILRLVQETHKEVRQIAHNLMPIDFENQNLVDVVKSFCEECTTENKPINFQTNTEKINLDKNRSMVLYRVVQEFIQNAIKHSQAQQIDVLLMENDGIVTINIEDDGTGFDTQLKETSKGLSGAVERIEKIKGRINIDSSGRGTSVFISIKS